MLHAYMTANMWGHARLPLGDLPQALGMCSWRHRMVVSVLKGVDDLLLSKAQGVEMFAAAKLLASQQGFSQGGSVCEALQD